MSLACAAGDVIPGQHGADCADPGTCSGCFPAPASLGVVCDWHAWRATHALAQIPGLVAHLRDHVTPGSAPARQDIRRTKGDAPPAPLNVGAVADADDLHAHLAWWVHRVLAEHPGRLAGPAWHGSDVRSASKHRDGDGNLVYEAARVTGTRGDHTDTLRLAQWLLTHQDWTLTQPWADAYVTDLPDQYWSIAVRWPVEERPKHLPTPCPRCDRLTLKRYPPTFAHGPVTIACTHHTCRNVIPEEQYGLVTRVVLHRQHQEEHA